MNPAARDIAHRLSLRAPQRESLELLAGICAEMRLEKGQDLGEALAVVQRFAPTVEDFEREFPSLCFALATGVGKTRLMGAFIAYLARAHRIRHFMVLAPNLTIYGKLIADFTPGSPKYVFGGITELAIRPPVLITGDDYERGHGVRDEVWKERSLFPGALDDIHINIFNISKINSEARGGKEPRIKRLSEYIGESYFDYLAGLPDLVMLMDESHRYRASAGLRAINELRPVLGLELTATPEVERAGRSEAFRNVAYAYVLANALRDGFVKEPAVATRADFDPSAHSDEALERIKLEDGVRLHELTKAELEVYAREHGAPLVKPFLLVIAKDTAHAEDLASRIESDDFFDGAYRGRLLTVHSKKTGEEQDEVVAQLLTVEDPSNPVEIVIHVNMLKEGWDVTNLYTIVPLRAMGPRSYVEQSLGRGLRLPFGKRTGVDPIDRLTIVAHDRFQEIVDHAKDPDSVIKRGIQLGKDVPTGRPKARVVEPNVVTRATDRSEAERAIAQVTVDVVRTLTHSSVGKQLGLDRPAALQRPEVQRVIRERVERKLAETSGGQLELYPTVVDPVASVVAETTAQLAKLTLGVPRIVVQPKGETARFRDFDLPDLALRLQPLAESIVRQGLSDGRREEIAAGDRGSAEPLLENYIVRHLVDHDAVAYDDHAELLYKLSGQAIEQLRRYLAEDQIEAVLRSHGEHLAGLILDRLLAHFEVEAEAFEVEVTSGFVVPSARGFTDYGVPAVDYRNAATGELRRTSFIGFTKNLFAEARFKSDPERRLAVLIEGDSTVRAWFQPSAKDLNIFHDAESRYEPDFIVETGDRKLLIEVKASVEMAAREVESKQRAAVVWCERATTWELANGGKPWTYVLVADSAIADNTSLGALVARFGVR